MRFHSAVFLCAASVIFAGVRAADVPASPERNSAPVGASVSYQLPFDGPLPKTYRVTLAVVDPKNPNWIISTFAAGVVRTVTAQNQGKFNETWDGLDENFMPVPAGAYGIKGIYMPAQIWPFDGQYHTIVPKLTSSGSSWGQTPAEDAKPDKIQGDPVDSPMRDVDVLPNGKGVLYFQYLENGTNGFLTDFTKPIGYDQIATGYSSGGIGGGGYATTDGKQIWILGDVEQQFILHADGTPFGNQSSLYCHNVYLPEGWVTGLSAWPDSNLGHSVLFASEHGKAGRPKPSEDSIAAAEDDQIVALDGDTSTLMATWKIERPLSVKVRGGRLYVLHSNQGKFEMLSLALNSHWRQATFSKVFTVAAGITPFDFELDSHERFYLSDAKANHVYQLDAQGKPLRTYGRLNAQKEGTYDPLTFMGPERIGCWTDATGVDRLLVVERDGPNRLSEWSGTDGTMIRQWVTPQTMANDGYAVDPRHPATIYMEGQGRILVRWKINYGTGQWTTDAIWHNVGSEPGEVGKPGGSHFRGLAVPQLIYHGNDAYLAFGRGYLVYHFEGERWRACAGVVIQKTEHDEQNYFWRDLNGDGRVEPNEFLPYPITPPPGVFARYFGDTFFDDLSFVGIGGYNDSIWKLTPGFDHRGTPIYDPGGWKKLLTDDVFVAKKAGTATKTHGGNEMPSEGYDSSWASVAEGADHTLYVDARSGPDFSANMGGQFKFSRYDPDGHGGYVQRWRVGRMALQGNARPGEVYGSIYNCPPVNGLVGIVDSARAGFEVYTTDGLYVDTLFPDAHIVSREQMGGYWQPGEYFSGYDYVNRDNGKVYFAFGKTMPKIYEAQGWTTTANSVRPLLNVDQTLTLRASEIATPPQLVLQIRGGPAGARVAQFSPAPGGGPALDGSMKGWAECDPVKFNSGQDQTVEARCAYDPEHLYIRWHARTGHEVALRRLLPIEHLFAHDRGGDTLGLYLQGVPQAITAADTRNGRIGDVRFVFGIFKDEGRIKPVVLGMYPTSDRKGAASVTYTTPVGSVHFGDVSLVPGATVASQVDQDGRGYVLVAAIPRRAIPNVPSLNGWRTEGNFDANFGGVDRFWWSNADGSASRETFDEPTEARLYPGSWSPIQFPAIDTLPIHSWMAIGPFGFSKLPTLPVEAARDEIIRNLLGASYPPDTIRDWSASYNGEMTQTRRGPHELAWSNVEVSTDRIDLGKAIGWSGAYNGENEDGVAFFVTHIFAPQAAQVRLDLAIPDGDRDLSAQLNGAALPEISENRQTRIDTSRPLSLRPGWNELVIRYAYIWGENNLGASITADPSILWKLKISARGPG